MRTNVTKQFRSRERNVHTFVPGNERSLCGRFVPGNESAWERNVPVPWLRTPCYHGCYGLWTFRNAEALRRRLIRRK